MTVRVEYATQLRVISGCAEEKVEIATPCTLSHLWQELVARHGERWREAVLADGHLRPGILLFLNDESIPFDGALELRDRDRVCWLALVSGG
ncbi:MAG: MoaD/ThiS family protein [Pirellulales bacterium]